MEMDAAASDASPSSRAAPRAVRPRTASDDARATIANLEPGPAAHTNPTARGRARAASYCKTAQADQAPNARPGDGHPPAPRHRYSPLDGMAGQAPCSRAAPDE